MLMEVHLGLLLFALRLLGLDVFVLFSLFEVLTLAGIFRQSPALRPRREVLPERFEAVRESAHLYAPTFKPACRLVPVVEPVDVPLCDPLVVPLVVPVAVWPKF